MLILMLDKCEMRSAPPQPTAMWTTRSKVACKLCGDCDATSTSATALIACVTHTRRCRCLQLAERRTPALWVSRGSAVETAQSTSVNCNRFSCYLLLLLLPLLRATLDDGNCSINRWFHSISFHCCVSLSISRPHVFHNILTHVTPHLPTAAHPPLRYLHFFISSPVSVASVCFCYFFLNLCGRHFFLDYLNFGLVAAAHCYCFYLVGIVVVGH